MACIAIVWNLDFLLWKVFPFFLQVYHNGFRLDSCIHFAPIFTIHDGRGCYANIQVSLFSTGHTAKLPFPGSMQLSRVCDEVMTVECCLILSMPHLVSPIKIFHVQSSTYCFFSTLGIHTLKMVVTWVIRSLGLWVTVWDRSSSPLPIIPAHLSEHWAVIIIDHRDVRVCYSNPVYYSLCPGVGHPEMNSCSLWEL